MPDFKNILASLATCAFILFGPSANAEKVLSGAVCSIQVHKLASEINWYNHLAKAQEAARKEGKLILWIQMVGKIDGAT